MMLYLLGSFPEKQGLNLTLKTHIAYKKLEKVLVDDSASLVGRLENLIQFEILTSKSCSQSEKGFGIIIKSENSIFNYNSSNPTSYFVNLYGDKQQLTLKTPLHSDPDSEMHGWCDSFFNQDIAWLSKIKNGKENEKLATFTDAIESQTLFCEALDSHQNKQCENRN